MAATFEFRRQKRVYDLKCKPLRYEPRRQHKHIGIVMLPGQSGQLHRPAKSRTYALMLVEGHAYAVARATHGYARVATAALYGLGTGMSEIGIIARFCRMSAKILVYNIF